MDQARRSKRRRVLKYTAIGTAVMLLAVAGFGYYLLHHLLGKVQTVSLDNLQHRPAAAKPNAEGRRR